VSESAWMLGLSGEQNMRYNVAKRDRLGLLTLENTSN